MSIPYLRFRPGLAGVDRQHELKALRNLGVTSLKRAFPDDDHPDRSAVYVIATIEFADRAALDGYLKESGGIIAISHEQYEDLRTAPWPLRAERAGAVAKPAPAKVAEAA